MYNKNRKCANDVNGFKKRRHVRQGSNSGLSGRHYMKFLWWSIKHWNLERAKYDSTQSLK